jgi:hypothetical protein
VQRASQDEMHDRCEMVPGTGSNIWKAKQPQLSFSCFFYIHKCIITHDHDQIQVHLKGHRMQTQGRSQCKRSNVATKNKAVGFQPSYCAITYCCIWRLHLFLHSSLPMIAPVPTSGMLRPRSAVLMDGSLKPAWMIFVGTFQRLGRTLRVPLSSLFRALMRREGVQSLEWPFSLSHNYEVWQ